MSDTPYTWQRHFDRVTQAWADFPKTGIQPDGSHMYVQVRRQGVTQCARVVQPWESRDGSRGWRVALIDNYGCPGPDAYVMPFNVRACGPDCRCAAAAHEQSAAAVGSVCRA